MAAHDACAPVGRSHPRHEVADIFRAHGQDYRRQHALTFDQLNAMQAIETCRTEVLGGHLDVCADCGHATPSYNSCRNRHCPKCQFLAQARWLEKRRERILPVHYFHVVFTLPSELRALVLWNRKRLFTLLFRTASDTLLTLGRDPGRLGALMGVTAVLHTWTRDLRFHPHLHCIVTGGGLSPDGEQWVDSGPNYLFPVKVLGQLFRGKFLDGMAIAHERGELDLPDDLSAPKAFERLRAKLFGKNWNVYAKRPFAGPEQVFTYLGRYTHRVGLSNHRILAVSDDAVTIDTRDGQTATMTPKTFIRRFLQHILPKGFTKIRHYGLMAASNVNTRLPTARQLLDAKRPDEVPSETDDETTTTEGWRELLKRLTGLDLGVCPACGGRRMQRLPLSWLSELDEPSMRAPPEMSA